MKKNERIYYYSFLPLIESAFQVRKSRGQELIINESNLMIYFDVNRRTIMRWINRAENDSLIRFIGKKRIFDDFGSQWAMNCYELISTETKYCSALQAFINNYMLWEPYFSDRLVLLNNYADELSTKKIVIAKNKMQNNQKLTKEEMKLLHKHEQNIIYRQTYPWATELLQVINNRRFEKFKSKYLLEGRNRETNVLCGSMNPDNEHVNASEQDLAERIELLKEYFNSDDFIEFDTNASIYRLAYALVHNRPLEHDVDVYEAIWNKAFYSIEFNKTTRNALKILCMPIFMSNGTKNAWNAIIANKTGKLTRSEQDRKDALITLSNVTGLKPREVMDELTAAMRKFIGTADFLEEEIFIHESNLHILMITMFHDLGINTINVYDGFYFIKGTMTQELFNQVYDDCTRQLIKNSK